MKNAITVTSPQNNRPSSDEMVKMIKSTKGKWFSCTFIKKDGSKRVMNGRIGCHKGLKTKTVALLLEPSIFRRLPMHSYPPMILASITEASTRDLSVQNWKIFWSYVLTRASIRQSRSKKMLSQKSRSWLFLHRFYSMV